MLRKAGRLRSDKGCLDRGEAKPILSHAIASLGQPMGPFKERCPLDEPCELIVRFGLPDQQLNGTCGFSRLQHQGLFGGKGPQITEPVSQVVTAEIPEGRILGGAFAGIIVVPHCL